MNSTTPFSDASGALFITSWEGRFPSPDFLSFCAERKPGGVIVFEEHCVDHRELHNSINCIRKAVGRPILVAIDQEGGRVCRLKGSSAEYGSAESYGKQAEISLTDALERYQGDLRNSLSYMRSLGINYFLGPVCDIDFFEGETALHSRVFGKNPERVAAFVSAAVSACKAEGMLSCLKHAPGLGRALGDPHIHMAVSQATTEELQKTELTPFRAGMNAGADSVMTSHFILKNIDSVPVTLSARIVTEVIRPLASDRPIITDDLTMGALNNFGSAGEIVSAAFAAGHDIFLNRDWRAACVGMDALDRELVSGQLSNERFNASLVRAQGLVNRIPLYASAPSVS